MRAVGDLGERLGARAEIVIGISEIDLGADQADGNFRLGLTGPLENAGVEHRRFEARIGADQQNCIGLVDTFDGRVEQIDRAALRRIEFRAVLAAIDIGRAERVGEQLQREHLLGGGEVAGNRRKAGAVEALQFFGDDAERLVPACGLELAVRRT